MRRTLACLGFTVACALVWHLSLAASGAALGAADPDAGPRFIWPEDDDGEPIRSATAAFLKKVLAADAAGARALFGGLPEDAALVDAYVAFVRSTGQLRDAVDARFGPGSFEMPTGAEFVRLRLEGLPDRTIVLNGNRASVSSGGLFDSGFRLARGKEGWRVTGLTAKPADELGLRTFFNTYASSLDELSKRVKADEFETAKAVEESLGARFDEALSEWTIPTKPVAVPRLEFDAFLRRLPGTPAVLENGPSVHLSSPEGGLLLVFAGSENDEYVLRRIYLHAEGADGYRQYQGELPARLSFDDRRREVERKLGPPPASSGGTGLTEYRAEYAPRGIEVDYAAIAERDPAVRIRAIAMIPAEPPKDGEAVGGAADVAARPRLAFRLVVEDGDAADPNLEPLTDPDLVDGKPMLVSREVLLDETAVAHVERMPGGVDGDEEAIALEMTPEGALVLARVTSANLNRRMAIVLDGRILIAPVILATVRDRVAIAMGTDKTRFRDVLGRLHAAVNVLPTDPPAAVTPIESGRE